MNAKDLLEAAKRAQGIPSNYRLARVLDVPEKTVSRWHTGKNSPGIKHAAKLADLAGLDRGAVVAAMQAESAVDPDEKTMWEGIAARLGKLSAVAAMVILSLWTTGGPDGGAMAATPGSTSSLASVDNALGKYTL